METKNGKHKKANNITFENAFKSMIKEMHSGKTIYLVFSKRNFHILVFVIAMSIIANIVLIDLLVRAPTTVQKMDAPIFVIQLSLSAVAIASGFWLFFKGINIMTDI